MNGETLEKFYQESLDERLIRRIAEEKNISLEEAMDFYYQSRLADEIYDGKYGIQYLDYKVLAQILIDTESERFINLKRTNQNA